MNIKVGFLGLNEKDLVKFNKILQISRAQKRGYEIENNIVAENLNIVIVNTLSDSAYEQYKKLLAKNPSIILVSIGKEQSPHHIAGMLLASRVYKVLDQIVIAPVGDTLKTSKPTIDDEPINSPPQIDSVAHVVTEIKVAETIAREEISNPAPQPEATKTEEAAFHALVVDDSELMQKAVLFELNKIEQLLNIEFAFSGEESLAMIEKKKYDFIFMDVMMPKPGMDGFDACAAIRKIPGMKKTPIIMLTSKTSPLDEVKGIMAGCTTYLTKPIKPVEFLSMMKRILVWLEKAKTEKTI